MKRKAEDRPDCWTAVANHHPAVWIVEKEDETQEKVRKAEQSWCKQRKVLNLRMLISRRLFQGRFDSIYGRSDITDNCVHDGSVRLDTPSKRICIINDGSINYSTTECL